MWPDEAACRALLAEAGIPDDVLAHVETVAVLVGQVAQAVEASGGRVDRDLAVAGAWLHDVGRAFTHGLDHALVGARWLAGKGLPGPLCQVVERHTGGGIDAAEARRLGLPAKDFTPRTVEERLVCACDNLVDGAKRQRVGAELAHLRSKGLEEAARKVEALHRDVSRMAGRDLDAFV